MSGRVLIFVLAAMSMGDPVMAQSICSVPSIRRWPGQTVDGTMTVKAGRQCSIVMNNSEGGVLDTRIVQKASVGAVSVNGQRIVYSAKSGYAGADQFAYQRDELNGPAQDMVSTVRVAVTVVP